jgi:hypothetical protein
MTGLDPRTGDHHMEIVCFRGDSRSPAEIYPKGFETRNKGAGIQPADIIYRPGKNQAGDIDPDTAVCVSRLLEAAAMFPLRMGPDQPKIFTAYLYCVFIDTKQCQGFLNTHAQQAVDSMAIGEKTFKPKDVTPATVMWPLFAHEQAVGLIKPEWVLFALENTQHWKGDTWTLGGSVKLKLLPPNYGRNIPDVYDQAAFKLRDDLLKGRTEVELEMPKGEIGYVTPAQQQKSS